MRAQKEAGDRASSEGERHQAGIVRAQKERGIGGSEGQERHRMNSEAQKGMVGGLRRTGEDGGAPIRKVS